MRSATVVFDFADQFSSIFVDESPWIHRISVNCPDLRSLSSRTRRKSLYFAVPNFLLVSKPRETPCKSFFALRTVFIPYPSSEIVYTSTNSQRLLVKRRTNSKSSHRFSRASVFIDRTTIQDTSYVGTAAASATPTPTSRFADF
jgi:hypothetical protein